MLKEEAPLLQLEKLQMNLVSFFCSGKLVFRFALLSGIVISLASIVFMHDIYRDVANVYAYYAREISMGSWQDGWVGRVPMLHILLSGFLSKITFLEAYRATIVISSLFYVLTLFPLRRFLERYLTPAWSAWGCVLFIFAPKLIRFSVSGLLDPIRYFFLIAALLYYFRSSDRECKWYEGVLLGLTLAGLAVSRGEELVTALMLLAGFPLFYLLKQRKNLKNVDLKRPLAGFLFATFFFIAGLLPFCYGNWKSYGVFLPDLRLKECIKLQPGEVEEMAKRSAPEKLSSGKENILPRKSRIKNILETFRSTLRGGYELYLFFTLLGAVLLLARRQWSWEFTAFIGLYLVHFIIYERIVNAYRYSLYLIPLFMPFTLIGLRFAGEKGREFLMKKRPELLQYLPLLLGLGLAFLLFGQTLNGLKCVTDRKDAPYRKAAAFIKEYAKKHFPGRRCRIATFGRSVVTLYWTGAVAVWGYKDYELYGKEYHRKDFDLLLISRKGQDRIPEGCGKLQEIPTQEEYPVRIFRKGNK